MKYFGPLCSPPAPECGEKVDVPEGSVCPHCDGPILSSDSGFTLPYVSLGGPPELSYHRLCLAEALGLTEKNAVI